MAHELEMIGREPPDRNRSAGLLNSAIGKRSSIVCIHRREVHILEEQIEGSRFHISCCRGRSSHDLRRTGIGHRC